MHGIAATWPRLSKTDLSLGFCPGGSGARARAFLACLRVSATGRTPRRRDDLSTDDDEGARLPWRNASMVTRLRQPEFRAAARAVKRATTVLS